MGHLLKRGGHLLAKSSHLACTNSTFPSGCSCCPTNLGCTICDNYATTPPTPYVGGKVAVITVADVPGSACCQLMNQTFMSNVFGGSRDHKTCSNQQAVTGLGSGICPSTAAVSWDININYVSGTNQTAIQIDMLLITTGAAFYSVTFLLVITGQIDCSGAAPLNIPLSSNAGSSVCPTAGTPTCSLSFV